MHEWHNEILVEEHDTILECLGWEGRELLSIEKTKRGYRIVELVENYGGTTLNQDQMERFIKELQVLAGVEKK